MVGQADFSKAATGRWSVRTFVVWLVLACLLPGVIGASWLLLHEYREGRAQIEKDTLQTARAMAQAIDNQILRVEALAHGLATASSLARGDLASFHSQARETLSRAKLVASVVLIDRSEWQVLNTLKEFGEPLPVAGNRELVRRVFQTAEPVVSDVYTAAVMRRPIMTVAVPVFVGGEVTYVLIAPILPDKFDAILGAQGLPEEWVTTILDGTGTIFARTQATDEVAGQKAPDDFLKKYMEAEESIFEAVAKDGIPVLSVLTRSPVTRWGVAIDIPKARLESALTRSLSMLALGVAALFAAGLALAWFMAARMSSSIRGLVAPALSLGAGEKVSLPPVAVREAAEVAEAIAHATRLLDERSAALRHANSQIDFLIRQSPAKIAVFDRDMCYLAASRRWAGSFGLPAGDLVGKSHYELLPDIPEAWKDAHRRGLAGETLMAEGEPWVRSDGSMHRFNWEVWPWRTESGAVGGIVITAEDVTERKAAEERVRASEEKYRNLFTNMSEGFALGEPIFDAEGRPVDYRFLEVNAAFYEQTGIACDIQGRPLREVMPQLERTWTDRYAAAALNGQSARIESYNADTRRYYDIYCFCPSPGRFAILFRDITARTLTEERLKDSEEKYRALFTNMAEGFVLGEPVLDPAGKVVDLRYLEVNEAFYLHTGIPRGITERSLREHLPQVEQEWIDRYAAVALTGREDYFERYNADTDRYYDVRAFSPTPGRFAILFRDVSDRRHAEQEKERHNAELERRVEERTAEVVQLQKMDAIGQLTGGVAHDFNNLLQGLASCLYVLDRYVPEGTPRTLYETATRSIESGARLTQALLAFARRQTLQPEPIDLRKLFDHLAPLLERTLGGMIRVEFAVEPETPAALADRSQLESALLNLAINARDAMPSGGRLTLRAAKAIDGCDASTELEPGEYVAISVEDTGTGMDEATRARVFEPFFTTKDFGKGSGLGLSMVHGMAAQAGGCVVIASQPGRGTTVTLYLPQASSPEIEAPGARAIVESGDGRVVLLVDDNDLMRDALKITLEAQGYHVRTAASGAAALALLRETGQIDALVTDYAMPGMSGAVLVREARSLRPALPVLLITGYAEELDDTDGIALLHKPFRSEDLLASVATMLKGGKPRATGDYADARAGIVGEE